MKRNNIYTALLSLSLLGLGACSLDLEPLTSPSSSSYPSSMEEANFGLNAVYSSLTAYSASTTTWWKVTDNITDIGATRVNTAMYTELITSGASAENAVATSFIIACIRPWHVSTSFSMRWIICVAQPLIRI